MSTSAVGKPLQRQPSTSKTLGAEKGPVALLVKALRADAHTHWEEEELLNTVHWLKQVLALVCGLLWGVVPLTGLAAFLGFVALNLAAVFCWYRMQRLDEDLYGGHQVLLSEGFPPSVAVFLIVWIATFTVVQH
ncbi:hypothetical protein WJX73_006960 [Symbiochloris irregularis]|uniref:Rab5-interacting protein n=1 Tax=Symbiochloris irregularis TaxID=706552 RepID=A0AAW1PW10_9CHLO